MEANESEPFECMNDPVNFYVFSSFIVTSLLLLPLSLYVLGLGFSRWKVHRVAPHLDHFTFHAAAMELLPACGCIVFCLGLLYESTDLMWESLTFYSPNWVAKLHFNTLTCVERYLAAVHPITYLGLKKSGHGVAIRNVSVAFLWLLTVLWPVFHFTSTEAHSGAFLLSLAAAFGVTSFCNLAVLRALIRPGPATGGGSRVKVDQSKKRAFLIVSAVFGVLFVAVFGLILCEILSLLLTFSECVLLNAAAWFTLPCSQVLPLLYLHRTCK